MITLKKENTLREDPIKKTNEIIFPNNVVNIMKEFETAQNSSGMKRKVWLYLHRIKRHINEKDITKCI